MKTLVIGGAGYIGSVLTRQLLEQGNQVTVLDNLRFGRDSLKDLESNDRFALVEGDLCDHVECCIAPFARGVTGLEIGADATARRGQPLGVKPFAQLGMVCEMVGFDEAVDIATHMRRHLAPGARGDTVKRSLAHTQLGRHVPGKVIGISIVKHGAGDTSDRSL